MRSIGWRVRCFCPRSSGSAPGSEPAIECAFARVLELRLRLAALGLPKGSGVRFQFSLWQGGLPMDAVPQQGWIAMKTTDPAGIGE